MSRPGELRVQMPCSLEAVERFCRIFRLWHAEHCPKRFGFASELLLREALVNGVVHGITGRAILKCVLRAGDKRLLMVIQDGGTGFDWRARRCRRSDQDVPNGRGLEIYYRYANRVRFNKQGNTVALVRLFPKPETPMTEPASRLGKSEIKEEAAE